MINLRSHKLRFLDLVGIGVFFLVLAMAFFFLLRKASYLSLVIRISDADSLQQGLGTPMWYLENIKPGMVQKDLLGRNELEVVKSYSQQSNSDKKTVFLTLKVITAYDAKSKLYSYQGVPISIGSYQTFRFNGILLRGVVQRIEDERYMPIFKKFVVEGYLNPSRIPNQNPYEAQTISNGIENFLAERFVKGLTVKDSLGKTIVEIKDIRKERATRRFVSAGQFIEVDDPERKRVLLKIEVLVEKYGDVYLFRDVSPIKINESLFLDFWDLGVDLTITDFKEI